MPRSKLFSSKEIVQILSKEGFLFISQKGSHGKFYRKISGRAMIVIVPMGKREIPRGTTRSIARQAGLSPGVLQ